MNEIPQEHEGLSVTEELVAEEMNEDEAMERKHIEEVEKEKEAVERDLERLANNF